jgi:hypothetical protein
MEIWPALIHLGYLQQYVNVHAEVATPAAGAGGGGGGGGGARGGPPQDADAR